MPSELAGTARWLLDIQYNAHLAQTFTEGLTYDDFCDNPLVFYAVIRCLEIISEASRRLPDDVKRRHPHIPWREIAGAGNVYRHDYEDVQQRLVWGTVRMRLGELLETVEQEIARTATP